MGARGPLVTSKIKRPLQIIKRDPGLLEGHLQNGDKRELFIDESSVLDLGEETQEERI